MNGKKIPDNSPAACYLKESRLRGFRTVRDTAINFEPGLNIIIGQNGVGKSNFLQYLRTSVALDIQHITHHDANLLFCGKNNAEIGIDIKSKTKRTVENGSPVVKTNLVTVRIEKNGAHLHQTNELSEVYDLLNKEQLLFSTVYITHGLPESYPLVRTPFSFRIDQNGIMHETSGLTDHHATGVPASLCLKNLLNFILYKSLELYQTEEKPTKKQLEQIVTEAENKLKLLSPALETVANIKGIRFNRNYNSVFDKSKSEYSVSNLFMEFNISGEWLPFSHLSDGTRRLYYIISEIAFPVLFYFQDKQFTVNTGESVKLILIEEPELGLHPGQLELLLHFLNESSNDNQIILTTHAPQVLDILSSSQLNKIIIARLTEHGTTLTHLTDKEQEKAALYMNEEAFLSDYWRFSDLEK